MRGRHWIMQLHMLLAGVMFPLVTIYLLTGFFYTLGVKGHIKTQKFTLHPAHSFPAEKSQMEQLAKTFLQERGLEIPRGTPVLKKKKQKFTLRWNDLSHSVQLSGRPGEVSANLVYKERSFLAQLMRIHRAQAGGAFKAFSIAMAACLMFVLGTGFYLASTMPRLRRPLLAVTFSGFLLFLVFYKSEHR